MLLVEEHHTGASTSMHTDIKMLYTEVDRSCGRGGRRRPLRNGGGGQEQIQRHNKIADNSFIPSRSRGVKVMLEADKERPRRTAGIVARRDKERSVGKSVPIRSNKEDGWGRREKAIKTKQLSHHEGEQCREVGRLHIKNSQ